jgi:hypothetical protein
VGLKIGTAEFAARRVRDDDWLFESFKDSCHV